MIRKKEKERHFKFNEAHFHKCVFLGYYFSMFWKQSCLNQMILLQEKMICFFCQDFMFKISSSDVRVLTLTIDTIE